MGDPSEMDVNERINDLEEWLDELTIKLHSLQMKQGQEDSGVLSTQPEARGNEDKKCAKLTEDVKEVKEKVCRIFLFLCYLYFGTFLSMWHVFYYLFIA